MSQPAPMTVRPPLTKIVATVGPASSDPSVLRKLIEAGVSIMRLNFSHGDLEAHTARLRTIRDVASSLGTHTAVLGDLQGPKIRVGTVREAGVEVGLGNKVIFQREAITASGDGPPFRFSSTYEMLVDEVEPGHRLLVNDGAIRMLVIDRRPDELECRVTDGGLITSGKGINLPDSQLSLDTITARDWEHVDWAIAEDLDFLALSFVRSGADIIELRAGIAARAVAAGYPGRHVPIIAKIEVPQALRDIDAIMESADGIMIARGDLGVEMDLAEVPVIQRRLVDTAQRYGKPSIVATQMLESMIERPTATRAEANDVATAILDQADAVMLSGETAVGRYPTLAVEFMRRVANATERYVAGQPASASPPAKPRAERYQTAALAYGVWTIAQDLDAACIVVWSQTGGGARYLSQNNFSVPIVAVTSDERMARQMQLLRGVRPVRMDVPESLAGFSHAMDQLVQALGFAKPGDIAVVIAGEPLGRPRVTNRLAILTVGDPTSGYAPRGALPDRKSFELAR